MENADEAKLKKIRSDFVYEIEHFIYGSVHILSKTELLKHFTSRFRVANAVFFFETDCPLFSNMISGLTKELGARLNLPRDTFYRVVIKEAVGVREVIFHITSFASEKRQEALKCLKAMKANKKHTFLKKICESLFTFN
ncbi:hypothetical protein PoB_000632800 [Plakobranchus ocellatus]|uniref:Uncharacterized protein n=1 Tax=Plakobranchus ocellatus TaxID=259542 RepID=A0AAV3YCF3_9GAST|nr:hypothetical protein PoB_000632800 [Plakobranchus ocellatus]